MIIRNPYILYRRTPYGAHAQKIAQDAHGRALAGGNLLGPELINNGQFETDDLSNWSVVGATAARTNDAYDGQWGYLISSTDGNADRAEYSIANLKPGTTYRCSFFAKANVLSDQKVENWTIGTIPSTVIDSLTYKKFQFDMVATAVSGVMKFFSSAGSTSTTGNTLTIDSLSFREVI